MIIEAVIVAVILGVFWLLGKWLFTPKKEKYDSKESQQGIFNVVTKEVTMFDCKNNKHDWGKWYIKNPGCVWLYQIRACKICGFSEEQDL